MLKNTKQQGNVTEVSCMLEFLKLGFNVLQPYGDCERYDFVADINGKFYKIQCKTCKEKNGVLSFSCRTNHRVEGKCVHEFYTPEQVDFFATFHDGICYLVPQSECKSEKNLRLVPTANGQTIGVSFAKNYELEKIIATL